MLKLIKDHLKIVIIVAVVILLVILFFFGGSRSNSGVFSNTDKKIVNDIDKKISDYLEIYGSSFSVYENNVSFMKCPPDKSKCSKKDMEQIYINYVGIHKDEDGKDSYEIKLSNLVTVGMLDTSEIKGANGKRCFEDIYKEVDPIIYVFQAHNKTYYYYVDLSGDNSKCNFSNDVGVISNLPVELVKELVKQKVDIPKVLADSIKKK